MYRARAWRSYSPLRAHNRANVVPKFFLPPFKALYPMALPCLCIYVNHCCTMNYFCVLINARFLYKKKFRFGYGLLNFGKIFFCIWQPGITTVLTGQVKTPLVLIVLVKNCQIYV